MLLCRCEALPIRFPRSAKLKVAHELSKEDEIAMKTACLIRHAAIDLSWSGLSDSLTKSSSC
jgi:hypothetical protein